MIERGKLRDTPEECEIGDALGPEWEKSLHAFEMWPGHFVLLLYDAYAKPDPSKPAGPYDHMMFKPEHLRVGSPDGELQEIYVRVDPEEMEKLCV